MPEIDYSKLSRQQKLAIFLIVVGPDTAAQILTNFDDTEVEAICREVTGYKMVPEAVQKQVIEEFSSILSTSVNASLGGLGFAQRTLEIAKGDYKASSILGRLGPSTGTSVDVIREISEMEGRQIFNLIKSEQPQTISFVLSYLDSAKAAEIFELLNPELREEVVERLGTIESTSLELVRKIVQSLSRHLDRKSRPAFHHSGGVRAVAGLLNEIEKDVSKSLLARIEERNSTLGAAIRRKMFSFEDIIRLQPSDLQRVLREVDSSSLTISMKSASETLREKIFASLSKRGAESMREEIALLGPVRLKDVEIAQDSIIQVVRRLEDDGQITLDNDADQSLVA